MSWLQRAVACSPTRTVSALRLLSRPASFLKQFSVRTKQKQRRLFWFGVTFRDTARCVKVKYAAKRVRRASTRGAAGDLSPEIVSTFYAN